MTLIVILYSFSFSSGVTTSTVCVILYMAKQTGKYISRRLHNLKPQC